MHDQHQLSTGRSANGSGCTWSMAIQVAALALTLGTVAQVVVDRDAAWTVAGAVLVVAFATLTAFNLGRSLRRGRSGADAGHAIARDQRSTPGCDDPELAPGARSQRSLPSSQRG